MEAVYQSVFKKGEVDSNRRAKGTLFENGNSKGNVVYIKYTETNVNKLSPQQFDFWL